MKQSPSRQRQQLRRDPESSLPEGAERHREEQDGETDSNQDTILEFIDEKLQPRARTNAKGAQVHRVDDVLAADDGVDGDGDHQRAEFTDLLNESAADLFELEAARLLRVHRQLEIAAEGRDEAHGQVHGVGDLVGQAESAEGDSIIRGIERIRNQNRHDGNAEDTHELTDPKKGTLDGDVQRGSPAEDGEGGFETTKQMLLLVDFRATAACQEGKKCKNGNKADNKQNRATNLLPRHT